MNYIFKNSSIVSVNSGTIVLNVSGKIRIFVDAKLVSAVDGEIVLDLSEPIYNEGTYLVIDLGNTKYRTFIVQRKAEDFVTYHASNVNRGIAYNTMWSLTSGDPIRKATPEEIQELDEQLAAEGKRWNPDTMQIEKLRLKPKPNDKYYFVELSAVGLIIKHFTWKNDCIDNELYKTNNCFKTKEDAEAKLEQIKQILNQ